MATVRSCPNSNSHNSNSRKPKAKPPKHWPEEKEGVLYITDNVWDSKIPRELLLKFNPQKKRTNSASNATETNATITAPTATAAAKANATYTARCERRVSKPLHQLVRIQIIDDPTHPAHGQRGLFAVRALEADTYIMDYCGRVTLSSDASNTSDYVLDFGGGLAVDAEKCGNEARMINDFRSTGHKPNVKFDLYTDPVTEATKVGVWTLNRKIKKGEELLITYGKSFWKSRNLLPSSSSAVDFSSSPSSVSSVEPPSPSAS